MNKISRFTLSFLLAASLFSGVASAHVTVQPKETTQGKYEVFTVRVPSEKEESPTMKVDVKFPEGVSVSRFEPKPGWKYEVAKGEDGKITGVAWTSEGDGLAPIEFTQFNFQGKVGEEATELTWKAYQTYQDGEVVEWVGAAGSDTPASVTTVQPKQAGEDGHDHGQGSTSPAQDSTTASESSTSNTSLYLSIAALIAGLLGLGISLKKKV